MPGGIRSDKIPHGGNSRASRSDGWRIPYALSPNTLPRSSAPAIKLEAYKAYLLSRAHSSPGKWRYPRPEKVFLGSSVFRPDGSHTAGIKSMSWQISAELTDLSNPP
jgi:hypothetical protein